MGSLDGKVAVVTGAARGIGQAVSLKLAAAGADLAVFDLRAEWLEETLGQARAFGRRAEGFSVNVAEAAAVRQAVDAVLQTFGRVDILVNNAGVTKDALLARMSEADWNDVLSVNLTGAFLMTRAVSRIMMKQRSGSIVSVASIIGLIGNAGQCNYAASKAGVIALTKSVARELASRNVRANAVAPGFIKTKMTEALPEGIQKKMLEAIPLGRFGEPDDVADVVFFLAGDSSAYVTGQTLPVCGGMVTA